MWVIAETRDFPAKLRKIVVTDDQGRFVLPELPPAQFDLWVRGYGLTDSKPMTAKSGQQNVKLAAVLARTPQEAAQSYPSNYWLSMINLPAASEFPGTGPKGNGIAPGMTDQASGSTTSKAAHAAIRSAASRRGPFPISTSSRRQRRPGITACSAASAAR